MSAPPHRYRWFKNGLGVRKLRNGIIISSYTTGGKRLHLYDPGLGIGGKKYICTELVRPLWHHEKEIIASIETELPNGKILWPRITRIKADWAAAARLLSRVCPQPPKIRESLPLRFCKMLGLVP